MVHPLVNDVLVDNTVMLQWVEIYTTEYKTYPFKKGVSVHACGDNW